MSNPAPLADIRVVARPHPFAAERIERRLAPGCTLADAVAAVGIKLRPGVNAHLFLGDQQIFRERWHRVKPKPGTLVAIRVVPTLGGGGGGAGGRKNIMRLVLSLASLAAGQIWGLKLGLALGIPKELSLFGTTFGAAQLFGSSAISLVSQLAIGALIRPTVPGGGAPAASATDPLVPQLTGVRNQANPYGVVPAVLGRVRLFPLVGARPYTEIVGQEQYLRWVGVVGIGPNRVSDIRIGETPIAQFDGVELEIREGWPTDPPRTLFTTDVVEEGLALPLTQAAGWVTRTTAADADEISVDIGFPGGLAQFPPQGKTWVRVEFDIEARDLAGGDWFRVQTLTVQEATTSAVRRTVKAIVKRGQYEVRVRRLTADIDHDLFSDEAFWTALRTHRQRDPISLAGVTTVSLRIQASNQLSGQIDQLSVLAESYRPVWDPSAGSGQGAWSWQISRNAAWHFAWLFTGAAKARPMADSRLALPALLAWAQRNAAAGRTLDAVVDQPSTVFQMARAIAAAGRARFTVDAAGKYSVVEDVAQAAPVQLFTPRNSWGFSWEKAFVDRPHALRIGFVNAAAGFQPDERIVYDDGHDAGTASTFEQLSAWGQTDPGQVWKYGRYMLAQGRLRPETFHWSCDVEHLVCQPGDFVKLAHDVILVGLAQGRIRTVTLDGGNACTGVTVDEPCPMEAGKTYALVIRRPDGTVASRVVTATVTTAAGEQTALGFATPIPAGQPQPAAGDLFAFGESGLETIDLVVDDIDPLDDLAARITALPLAPGVHAADQGSIPAYATKISRAASFGREAPAPPVVLAVASDETVLIGDSTPRILISLAPRPGVFGAMAQARFRRLGSETWLLAEAPAEAREISLLPVDEGAVYEFQLRSSTLGLASAWTAVQTHTVAGRRAPPAGVTGLRRENRFAVWNYGTRPRDFAGFRVRYRIGAHPAWSDATPAHAGLTSETRLDLSNLPRGQLLTVMVKAVDTAGNESAAAAHMFTSLVQVVTQGDAPIANVVLALDQAAAGWPGALEGGAIAAGLPKAGDAGGLLWAGSHDAPLWSPNPNTPLWTGGWTEMSYTATLVPAAALLPARLTVAAAASPPGWQLDYRTESGVPLWSGDDTAPLWSSDGARLWEGTDSLFSGDDSAPLWGNDGDLLWGSPGPFRPWPGALDLTRQPYEIRLRTPAGALRGQIDGMTLTLDVEDVAETLSAVALAAAGTRLPIVQSYREILSVRPTLRDDGGSAVAVKIVDRDPTLGPLLRAFDAAGAGTTASVDVDLKGY